MSILTTHFRVYITQLDFNHKVIPLLGCLHEVPPMHWILISVHVSLFTLYLYSFFPSNYHQHCHLDTPHPMVLWMLHSIPLWSLVNLDPLSHQFGHAKSNSMSFSKHHSMILILWSLGCLIDPSLISIKPPIR